MIQKLDPNDAKVKSQIERIVIRLSSQGHDEIQHVLTLLFPSARPLGLSAVAEDLADNRDNRSIEFTNLVQSEVVDADIFKTLAGDLHDKQVLSIRSSFDPSKFEITLTCARTPLKEFFEECQNISCESCIQNRITAFQPWSIALNRVEQRRTDLCKKCGHILTDKDEVFLRNERLMYTCSFCGHRGWNPAK